MGRDDNACGCRVNTAFAGRTPASLRACRGWIRNLRSQRAFTTYCLQHATTYSSLVSFNFSTQKST